MKKVLTITTIFLAGVSFGSFAHAKDAKKTSIDLAVTEKGFEPSSIDVKPGSDVILNVTRKTDTTCATQIQVPSKNLNVELPLNKAVPVALGKVTKGEIKFACGMNMISGVVIVK